MTSEHYTYRRGSEGLWNGAEAALHEFNKRYQEAHQLYESDATDALDRLLRDFAFLKNGTAPSFLGPFHDWMSEAFYLGDLQVEPDSMRPKGRMILEILDGKSDITEFFSRLDEYSAALNTVLRDVAPESFTYQGFKIKNPDRLGDKMSRRLLGGVDYVVALFKKRDVLPALHAGIQAIELLPSSSMKRRSDTADGLYTSTTQTIALSSAITWHGGGRLEKWVDEVFLHEFGHYVHLNYLPKAAKAVWDASWDDVKEKQEALTKAFKSISSQERAKFFDVLLASGFDASRAAKRLESVARVKFGVWLRSPETGDPLITAKQFRWTRSGQYAADFFADREKFMRKNYDWMSVGSDEYDRQIARVDRQIKSKLGLSWEGNMAIPSETVKELTDADPTMRKTVEDALDKLEIVSPYGRTNEKEDFAETFVAFVGAPEKLTPTAKFRMQRTLSVANLYGKPVMRLSNEKDSLAQQVVSRYLHGCR